MTKLAEELAQFWRFRLLADNSQQPEAERESIVCWLLGEGPEQWDSLSVAEMAAVKRGMEYRYGILLTRYLGVNSTQAYRTLINRLGSLVLLREKIRNWVALSRDRQRAVTDVLQEVIQEMLNSDRYLQSQLTWIGKCTEDERLRNSLLFTSLEEYCLRPIRNQPLLAYRFLNFLRRSQRGGMTQVPRQEVVQMISEAVAPDETDRVASWLDERAVLQYQEAQNWQERQALHLNVKMEFSAYLEEKVGQEAVAWLSLYLQGRPQEEIATCLNLPVRQVYRLREKVGYHAIHAFALKGKPELVAQWLEISLQEHNLGLTPQQWQAYWQQLNPRQGQILQALKEGESLEAIAESLNCKKGQVMKEWSQLYLAAQSLRNHEL